jgi:hypothetical protein
MSKRLGNVLYWAGCILAGLAVLFGGLISIVMWQSGNPNDHEMAWFPAVFASVGALITWLIGRALQYVVSGK